MNIKLVFNYLCKIQKKKKKKKKNIIKYYKINEWILN